MGKQKQDFGSAFIFEDRDHSFIFEDRDHSFLVPVNSDADPDEDPATKRIRIRITIPFPWKSKKKCLYDFIQNLGQENSLYQDTYSEGGFVSNTLLNWGQMRIQISMSGKTEQCTSVSDPGPWGSVLKWLPRIQNRIRIENTDPDPGQSKSWKNLWF